MNGEIKHSWLIHKSAPELQLEDLVEGITDDNRHGEINWGPTVGKEEISEDDATLSAHLPDVKNDSSGDE